MDLIKKKCVPCEGGAKPLSKRDAQTYRRQTPAWTLRSAAIERRFVFKNFVTAMRFVNKVAKVAEADGHHPDIYVSYNKVRLTLSTHAIGGLSINDFILAAKIDRIVA